MLSWLVNASRATGRHLDGGVDIEVERRRAAVGAAAVQEPVQLGNIL